ncbi:unnamed protein product, partial [marine sediment metagenome]
IGTLLAARPAEAAPENEKLQYLIDLQTTMVQQLQRLVQIAEQLIGEVPIIIEPKITPSLVSIPLDPEVLNRALQAMGLKGQIWVPTIRQSWACPAGATTVFPLGVPSGFVDTRRIGTLSSDFYDPNVSVQVFVDDSLVTPFGIALTGQSTVDFGEFFVKHREILISTTNNTATDAVLTLEVTPSFLLESFYEEFYRPIIEYMYRSLQGVAYG